jgi:hypothetical protein
MSGAAMTFSFDQQAHAEPDPIAAPLQQQLPSGLREDFAAHFGADFDDFGIAPTVAAPAVGPPFPEWERARQNAHPQDDAQKRLVELLQQPIGAREVGRLATRKHALQDLVEGIPNAEASRMYTRVSDPKDALGQFTTFELSRSLRDELVDRLAARRRGAARGVDPQQRGLQPPGKPTPMQAQRSTGPASAGVSSIFPFLGPPLVVPFPGITSPQYYPWGYPGIAMGRPVLLVPTA